MLTLQDDLKKWYPEIADRLKITLIEALPNVDTGRTSTDDDHVHQSVNLLLRLVLESGGLDAWHQRDIPEQQQRCTHSQAP
jgi:hypothetical protein